MYALEKTLEELNLLGEERFESEMNDPIIVIDKTHIPNLVRHNFSLWIDNTSDGTLYFKIVEELPNWVLGDTPDVPADGKLGAIAAGSSKHFIGLTERSLPVGESEDDGRFKVECYPDDTYTGLIESHSHPTTIYIEDLESWSNVQKSDFDDGTSQGWSLHDLGISGARSIAEGGYSLWCHGALSDYSRTPTMTKTIALPNTSKVRIGWFFLYRVNTDAYRTYWVKNFTLSINGEVVMRILRDDIYLFYFGPNSVGELGWFKAGADISTYKGQSVEVELRAEFRGGNYSGVYAELYIDDVVIAGKN